MKKVSLIGNSCGGKTTLAKKLSLKYNLPLYFVDQIQFKTGLVFRDYKETTKILQNIQLSEEAWIIDGYGPLNILEERLKLSDVIIFIDLPLYLHYFFACKRVLKNFFVKQRSELPENSSERNLPHILKLFKTIHQIHTKMRPEMIKILNRKEYKNKTIFITKLKDFGEWD